MEGKWMVYDTGSGDIIFHDSKEKAEKDYQDACKDLESGGIIGETKVYMFRVEKAQTFVHIIQKIDEQYDTNCDIGRIKK